MPAAVRVALVPGETAPLPSTGLNASLLSSERSIVQDRAETRHVSSAVLVLAESKGRAKSTAQVSHFDARGHP
jgi:hypothetical protein